MATLFEEDLPGRGQQELAAPALEEADLQGALELTDAGAHGGLRHVERAGSGAHALESDDGRERAQQIEIHEPPLLIDKYF
jgi:hypothetical protein